MILIDASVAFKWFIPEEGAAEAQRLILQDDGVVAPQLILAEVGNALWKARRRGALSADDYKTATDDLRRSFAELLRLDELVNRAAEIARVLDHPIYDCFYLATAEQRGQRLITADRRLLRTVVGTAWESLCCDLSAPKET